MKRKELEERSASLKLFLEIESNRDTTISMIKDGGNYLYQISQNFDYRNWDNIMRAWEIVSSFKSDNLYPNEFSDGTILIDEMKIGRFGATIKAFQSKNGVWVNKNDGANWRGLEWMSYNIYIKEEPEYSNSNSFQEAVWKTITDFTLFWCTENVSEFNFIFER